jgi:hypothetical protein
MSRRELCYLSTVFLVCACTHTDLRTNAPGLVDLSRPPQPSRTSSNLSSSVPEEPRDPGEQLISVSYGGFAGAGFQMHGPFPQAVLHGTYALGPEVSVGYGTKDPSHREDEPLAGNGVYANRALDINLGWSVLSPLGKGVGPLYAEVEYRWQGMVGIAAGWTWGPEDRTQGPQSTINFGPFYSRLTCEMGLGTQVTFGLVLKGEHAWVWSR